MFLDGMNNLGAVVAVPKVDPKTQQAVIIGSVALILAAVGFYIVFSKK